MLRLTYGVFIVAGGFLADHDCEGGDIRQAQPCNGPGMQACIRALQQACSEEPQCVAFNVPGGWLKRRCKLHPVLGSTIHLLQSVHDRAHKRTDGNLRRQLPETPSSAAHASDRDTPVTAASQPLKSSPRSKATESVPEAAAVQPTLPAATAAAAAVVGDLQSQPGPGIGRWEDGIAPKTHGSVR